MCVAAVVIVLYFLIFVSNRLFYTVVVDVLYCFCYCCLVFVDYYTGSAVFNFSALIHKYSCNKAWLGHGSECCFFLLKEHIWISINSLFFHLAVYRNGNTANYHAQSKSRLPETYSIMHKPWISAFSLFLATIRWPKMVKFLLWSIKHHTLWWPDK